MGYWLDLDVYMIGMIIVKKKEGCNEMINV